MSGRLLERVREFLIVNATLSRNSPRSVLIKAYSLRILFNSAYSTSGLRVYQESCVIIVRNSSILLSMNLLIKARLLSNFSVPFIHSGMRINDLLVLFSDSNWFSKPINSVWKYSSKMLIGLPQSQFMVVVMRDANIFTHSFRESKYEYVRTSLSAGRSVPNNIWETFFQVTVRKISGAFSIPFALTSNSLMRGTHMLFASFLIHSGLRFQVSCNCWSLTRTVSEVLPGDNASIIRDDLSCPTSSKIAGMSWGFNRVIVWNRCRVKEYE